MTARATLTYVSNVKLTNTSGAIQEYDFRCNSIFDPDYSGVGHQPLGHDQYANVYSYYVVRRAKCTFTYRIDSSVNDTVMAVGLVDADGTSAASNISTAAEQSGAVSRVFPGVVAPPGPEPITIQFDAAKYWKGKQPPETAGALMSQNPVDQAFFTFVIQSAVGTSTFSGVLSTVIKYDVEMSQRIELGQS